MQLKLCVCVWVITTVEPPTILWGNVHGVVYYKGGLKKYDTSLS